MSSLTHLDADGRARMVDVGGKPETEREAIARGHVQTTPEVVRLIAADDLPKADVLATARVAGISGAKRTGDLIPLCHPLPLTSVSVDFELDAEGGRVGIEARAKTVARTGVEMEALTAVAIAGLTLHDMIKAVDPASVLTEIGVVEKRGGRHGAWRRDEASRTVTRRSAEHEETHGPSRDEIRDDDAASSAAAERVTDDRALVLVSSTRAAGGETTDTTGPAIADWLAGHGLDAQVRVVPDARIRKAIRVAVGEHPRVILTTGGTGVSPDDRTPEATAAVLDRELPGVAELMRTRGAASTPLAALGRGLAGVAGRTIIVNLPGSRGAVADGLAVLDDLLPHLLDQVRGGDHA
jgi:cyclic pyranopterin phosphate synthase